MSDYTDRRDRIEIVVRITPPLSDMEAIAAIKSGAAWVLSEFGKGADPDAERTEDHIGHANSHLQGPYVQIMASPVFGQVIEYMADEGLLPAGIELLEVRWPQLTPETGWTDWTWEETVDGVTTTRHLGVIT